MRHSILVFAALNFLAGVSFIACSSSDDGGGSTAGSSGSAGSGGSAGTGGAGGTAGSGGSGTAGTTGCDLKFNYTGYTAATMPTFTADIYPLFTANNCTLAGVCHGAGKITPLLAATSMSMADLDAVRMRLVGVNSVEATTFALVKAGDPENSWLMKKLDGSQNCEGLTCSKHPGQAQAACGAMMPQTATTPLDLPTRTKVRDWIKQGAKL